MEVLGLEGLNENYEKFRGIVKMGQSTRDKIGGAKCNFSNLGGKQTFHGPPATTSLRLAPTDHGKLEQMGRGCIRVGSGLIIGHEIAGF